MVGYAIAAALLLVSYALSLARVCLIGAAVLVVCIVIAERRRPAFWLLLLPLGILTLIALISFGVIPSFTPQSLSRLDLANGNVTSGRVEHWEGIFHGMIQNGAWTSGLGIRGADAVFHLPTENFFVAAFADFGVILGTVYLLIVAKIWFDLARDAGRIPDAGTRVMTRGLLAAVMLLWMFNDVTSYFQAFPLFALTLGAALSLGSPAATPLRGAVQSSKSFG